MGGEMAREGGSTSVTRPMRAAPANGGAGGPVVRSAQRKRVLLVEDNRNLRVTTSRMLGHLGFDVTAAANGTEAVELFRGGGQPPDVVVLDALMPGMNGVSVLRALRELAPGVPVVMCSGSPEELSRAEAAGEVAAVLGKPYDLDTLAETLRRALGGLP